jgi:hypothetical protein
MSIANRLLEGLEGVKQTSSTTWMAKCPVHDDRTASLSVRDIGDSVLVHCFGLCPTSDVMAALGLNMADLFERTHDYESPHRKRQPFPARDVLAAVAEDVVLVAVASVYLREGRALSEKDGNALLAAASRLREAARLGGGL